MLLVTENDAIKKWCPMARQLDTRQVLVQTGKERFELAGQQREGPYNRISTKYDNQANFPNSCRCIGRMCMLWQWEDGKEDVPGPDGFMHGPNDKGYCGLGVK